MAPRNAIPLLACVAVPSSHVAPYDTQIRRLLSSQRPDVWARVRGGCRRLSQALGAHNHARDTTLPLLLLQQQQHRSGFGLALLLAATYVCGPRDRSEAEAATVGVKQTPVAAAGAAAPGASSASFQVAAALDLKEEKEKVKLARFLREVHDVSESKRSSLLRRYTTVTTAGATSRSPTGPARPDVAAPQVVDGRISLRGVELLSLDAARAHELIARLVSGQCRLDRDSLVQLCKAAAIALKQDDTLVDLTGKETVTVVGDIHGSLSCLKQVLRFVYMTGSASDAAHQNDVLVFNGDFVDRGPNGLEVLCTLLLLKLAYPSRVYLIRGNHEDTMVSSVYGFMEELQSKYERTDRLWYELSKVFGALPLAALSDTAFIVHGGIPQRNFQLEEVQSITTDERSRIGTVVDPRTEHERLIEAMLWSDPQDDDGIKPNHRGTGIVFGPDVSREFLKRYKLKYLIRSHQPVERGVQIQDCGDECFVVTVFSTANYPNGEGSNNGGVIHLDKQGQCNSVEFRYGGGMDYTQTIQSILSGTAETILNYHRVLWHDAQRDEKPSDNDRSLEELLRSYVADKRNDLEGYFSAVEDKSGLVSKLQWAVAMEDVLDLKDVPWAELQPKLAPTVPGDDDYIDWRAYLKKNASEVTLDALQDKQLAVLRDYKDKLMAIFEYFDKDASRKVSKEEFEAAIQSLNRQYVPKHRRIKEPGKIFKVLDASREGSIDLKDLHVMLTESQILALICQTLGVKQMTVLQQNHEGLTAAFKVMDADRKGTIDRQAFVAGVELLNKRLPSDNKLNSIDQLFNLLDFEGTGRVDINKFSQLFQSL